MNLEPFGKNYKIFGIMLKSLFGITVETIENLVDITVFDMND